MFFSSLDLISTRFGYLNPPFHWPNQVEIRSKFRSGGGVRRSRGQRGRSGWEGPVAPPESLDFKAPKKDFS